METPEIIIRPMLKEDINDILGIYNYFAENSFAVYSPFSINAEQLKMAMSQARITLVVEANQRIIGFGSVSAYKPFSNFNRTGVLSYFLIPEFTGKGIGTKLYTELLLHGKKLGIYNYLAHISSKNQGSLNFHQKLGFEEVGRFKSMCDKFGEMIDIVWVQKMMPE